MVETVVKREEANGSRTQSFVPHADILETPEEVRLVLDVPGVAPEELDVHFEKGTLLITGRTSGRGPEGGKFLLREYGVGDYRRTFQVGDKIEANSMTAEYHQGVLTIRLPKAQEVRPRKVNVQVVH